MSRTYMKAIYGFPLVNFLFSLSALAMIGLIQEIQYFVGLQCTDSFIMHCPQGAFHEAVAAGRDAFALMALASWLYGLAMLVLAGTMGRVKLALICHAIAVVAAFVGWRAGMLAEDLVLWTLLSMMLTTLVKGVSEGVWYGWQVVRGKTHSEQKTI